MDEWLKMKLILADVAERVKKKKRIAEIAKMNKMTLNGALPVSVYMYLTKRLGTICSFFQRSWMFEVFN